MPTNINLGCKNNKNTEYNGKPHYLLKSHVRHFMTQKTAKRTTKDGLLACNRRPFALQFTAFRNGRRRGRAVIVQTPHAPRKRK